MPSLPVAYRYAQPADTSFFMNSYLKSFREAGINKAINTHEYYTLQGEWVNTQFVAPYSHLILAVNPETPDQIYAYIWYFDLGDHRFINWLYVKQPFRKFGLARNLIEQALLGFEGSIYYTHFNANVPKLKNNVKHCKYVPFYYLNRPGESK